MIDFPTFLYASTCEIPTLLYTWSLKKVPLSGRAPRIGHKREYPPPPREFTLLLAQIDNSKLNWII